MFFSANAKIKSMSNNQLREQLKKDIERWECQEVEFIEDYPSNARELAKEIAAFASSNLGTIYLGVDNDGNIKGVEAFRRMDEQRAKDDIQNRISNLTRDAVRPYITVKIDFIEVNNKVVVKITVPKGDEPIYYAYEAPYIRNLTSSQPATPEKVKELHMQYFLSREITERRPKEVDKTQKFLLDLLMQLSDFQILWFDHETRVVNPDLDQMLYDMRTTGEIVSRLASDPIAEEEGLSRELQKIGDSLERLSRHQFYIDGGKSWQAFKERGSEILQIVETLMPRISKRMRLTEDDFEAFKNMVLGNIAEIKNHWHKRKLYSESNELPLLKEHLRRLAYNFNRLANIPSQFEEFDFSLELGKIAKILREVSSVKYFRPSIGFDPIKAITSQMDECLSIAEKMDKRLSKSYTINSSTP